MIIELLTYLRVASESEVGDATRQEHDSDTDELLNEHLQALRKYAARGDVPNAQFREDRARNLFQTLRSGTEDQFLAASTDLTLRLQQEMDGRASPGLMVFVRAFDEEDGVSVVAALKLQVATAYAGILQAVAEGEQTLQAVRDVLDAPGKIQKGVSFPDPRGSSDIVVGDKLGQSSAAEYFVKAFGITIDSRPAEATVELIRAVSQEAPGQINEVIEALPAVTSTEIDGVMDELVTAVPELETSRQAISDKLDGAKRPIRDVATQVGLKLKVTAGPIAISGPAAVLDRSMSILESPERGGWNISIDTDDPPQRKYVK